MKEELEAVMMTWALQSEANTKQLLNDPDGTFEQIMGVELPEGLKVMAGMEGENVSVSLPPEEVLESMAAIFVGQDTYWPDYWAMRSVVQDKCNYCKSVQDYGTAMAVVVCKCEKCKVLAYEKCDDKCDSKCKLF
jgi:hypothetical protein